MNIRLGHRCPVLMIAVMALSLWLEACDEKVETGDRRQTESAAEGSPVWIVQQFFARDSFPQADRYLDSSVLATYAATGSTFGTTLAPEVKVRVRSLEADAAHSTVAVEISDTATTFDLYCYLDRGPEGWKLSTLRSLSGTGIMWAVVAELDTMATIPDSMRYIYDNCKLTISSDSALKAYLTAHQVELDGMAEALNANGVRTRIAHNAPRATADEVTRRVADMLEELHLASVEADSTGLVEVLVGGVGDNMVCYLYVPVGDLPPIIDRDRVIYAEYIIGRWYIFKTT